MKSDTENDWWCDRCDCELSATPVQVAYRGSAFPVELPRCPNCGMVFVSESLALGRMAEAEKMLEDK